MSVHWTAGATVAAVRSVKLRTLALAAFPVGLVAHTEGTKRLIRHNSLVHILHDELNGYIMVDWFWPVVYPVVNMVVTSPQGRNKDTKTQKGCRTC